MADPRVIVGRIVSVQGTTPGPASGITYTIAIHDANVEGIFQMDHQTPVQRWPDALDTVALPVGMLVIGAIEANVLRWHFMEFPAFKDCATANPNLTIAERFTQLGGLDGGVRPPPGGVTGVGGTESAPVPDAGAQD